MTKEFRILLVEDNPGDARLISETIQDVQHFNVDLHWVDCIKIAQARLDEESFDLVLLDLSLPDGQGLETVKRICSSAPHLPVIVLTGLDNNQFALDAIQCGAQDYLIKGQVDAQLFARAISYSIERKQLESQLQYLATHDSLTGLPNRTLFIDRFEQAIVRAQRAKISGEKYRVAFLLLDLDKFKKVNDTFGHIVGDLLLQEVALRLQGNIRRSNTVARLGGDEFTILFDEVGGMDDYRALADKVALLFNQAFQLAEHSLHIQASIGGSIYPEDGESFEKLYTCADKAMYYSKETGNTVRFYHDLKNRISL